MSNKILVGNLPLDATEESLREHVESIGKVRKIVMPQNRKGQLLGFAQITLSDRAEAIKAQNLLLPVHYKGRQLTITLVKEVIKTPERFSFGSMHRTVLKTLKNLFSFGN